MEHTVFTIFIEFYVNSATGRLHDAVFIKLCNLFKSSVKSNIVLSSSYTNWHILDLHSSSGHIKPKFNFLISGNSFQF
jgi:hypothetical protein